MLLKKNNKNQIIVTFLILIMTFSFLTVVKTNAVQNNYFFKVELLCRSDSPTRNIADLIVQSLQQISIQGQLTALPAGAFESALISKDFDMVILDLEWPSLDIDPSLYFTRTGAGNYWGIDSNLAGYEENEEYLQEGLEEMDSSERATIYQNWQEHLMSDMLPIIPLFNTKSTYVTWSTLSGWEHSEGIVSSLPNMKWDATHFGQDNDRLSTFIDYIDIDDWDVLNPLYVEDDTVISLISEPLIRFNSDNEPMGILATNWEFSENDTKLTILLRENIKWQSDPDGLYTNEYFSANDVLFSIKMYKEVSTIGTFYDWVESVEMNNESAITITIDSNNQKIGRQPYAPAISDLTTYIIPEHYLNVSVDIETGLPDTNGENWVNFGANGLGTGMYSFVLDEWTEVSGQLDSYDDWWGISYYGNTLDIEHYLFNVITDQQTKQTQFESGAIDIFKDYRETYDEYDGSSYQKQTKSDFTVYYLGFNLQSTDCPEIHDNALTEDSTMSKGLAVRKAIAHVIDKSLFDDSMDIEIQLIDTPFSNKFETYIKQDITIYDYNLETAKEYMTKAGYDPNTLGVAGFTIEVITSTILLIALFFTLQEKRIKRENCKY